MRSIRSDINFDALQREIDEAEEYLVRRSFNSSVGSGSAPVGADSDAYGVNSGAASDVRASRDGSVRRSFDDARHEAILGTVGRRPLSRPSSASSTTATANTSTTASNSNGRGARSPGRSLQQQQQSQSGSRRTPSPKDRRGTQPQQRASTPTNHRASGAATPTNRAKSPRHVPSHDHLTAPPPQSARSSRYVDAAERERLLNRLLGDNQKSSNGRDRNGGDSGGRSRYSSHGSADREEEDEVNSSEGRASSAGSRSRALSNASDAVSTGEASATSHTSLYFASDLAQPSNIPGGDRISKGRGGALDESSPIDNDSLDGKSGSKPRPSSTSIATTTTNARGGRVPQGAAGNREERPRSTSRSRPQSAPAVRRGGVTTTTSTTTTAMRNRVSPPSKTAPMTSDAASRKYRHVPVFSDESPLNERGRFGRAAATTSTAAPASSRAVFNPDTTADSLGGNMTTDTAAKRQHLKSAAELRAEADKEFRNMCTFAPTLVSDKKWLPVTRTIDSDGGSNQEQLLQKIEGFRLAHEARQRKREQEKRELDAMELQECTFKPQICKGSESIVKKQQFRSRSLSPHLANRSVDSQVPLRSALARDWSQNASLSMTSRGVSSSAATRASVDDSVVSQRSLPPGSGARAATERLYNDAHERQIDLTTRAHFLRRAQDQEATFKPQINESSEKILRKSDYKPIFDRLGDEQRARSAYRERLVLQQERELSTIMTNKPSIAPKSRTIVAAAEQRKHANTTTDISSAAEVMSQSQSAHPESKNFSSSSSVASAATSSTTSPNDVSQRLFAYTKEMQSRRSELIKKHEEEQARQMQRSVPVSRGSELIAARSEESGLGFLDRQAIFEAQYKRQAALRKAKEDALDAELFRPVREKTSDLILRETRPEVLLEGPEERARRLSSDDKKVMEMHKQELERRVYDPKVYSFSPHIDKVSRILGRDPSLTELHENRRGQRARMEAQRRADERVLQDCSFAPKLTPYVSKNATPEGLISEDDLLIAPKSNCPVDGRSVSSGMTSASSRPVSRSGLQLNLREPERMSRDIKMYLKEKEDKRREAFIAKEIEELNECTFKPTIPENNSVIFQHPVVVRGIARHLQLQALSDKLKKTKMERAETAFKVRNAEKFQRTSAGTTVVKEFHLSEPSNKMSRSVADMLNKEFSNLTFEPKTVDANRRSYAREVMNAFE